MKIKLIITSLFISHFLFIQHVNAQIDIDNFSKIIGTEPSVEINLGKTMLGLLSSATDEDKDVSAILSALSAINVIVYELDDLEDIQNIKTEIKTLTKNKITAGYETIASIKEEDSLVYVLANMDAKNLKSLSIFALDDEDELVLIEIQGSLLISQIGKLMAHFDVDVEINSLKINSSLGSNDE
ncbi:MAG: DUF4252 domain-containing protein [Proteobacteria bacterium]|nr:DUF4252 domain-containing protein [Pseudomonadota bacterium]